MQIWFIGSLLFAVLVAVFAIMNSEPVTVRLLWAKYEFSQAIVILGSATIGAIVVGLLGGFQYIRLGFKKRELQGIIRDLEQERDKLLTKIPKTDEENQGDITLNNKIE